MRAEGARYLIFPATSLWWLEFYGDFRAHLEAHYRQIVNEDEVCMIFALQERRSSPGETGKIAGTENGSSLLSEPEDEISLRIELAKSLKALGRAKQAQRTLASGLNTEPVSARLHIALMQLR